MTSVRISNRRGENSGDSELYLRNSAANIATGASTILFSLYVPSALARALPAAEFSIWALVLQIAGYTAILNLGLQDAVGRYVAFHEERRDVRSRDEFIRASLWVLMLMAIVATGGIAVATLFIDEIFPQIPPSLIPAARIMLLSIGVTLSCGLPLSTYSGILIGLRRNSIVAGVVGTSRLVLAILLGILGWASRSLYWLTVCFVTVTASSYVVTWAACRNLAGTVNVFPPPRRDALGEVWSYCGATTLWQVCYVMISGLDVVIVGRMDFQSLSYYIVCLAPITILSGLMLALFSPLLQLGAIYAARQPDAEMGELLARSTRLATIVLGAAALPLIVFDREILVGWLGAAYAAKAAPILWIVVVGHGLRLLALPYTTLLLAAKRQDRILLSPLVEGVVNVATALVAGRAFGVRGVASAVVVGAVVGQLMNYYYNLPRTHGRSFDRAKLLGQSVVRPALCFSPLCLLVLSNVRGQPEYLSVLIRLVPSLASYALVWKFAVSDDEKELVRTLVNRGASWIRRTPL